jgi:hypothetical protein
VIDDQENTPAPDDGLEELRKSFAAQPDNVETAMNLAQYYADR